MYNISKNIVLVYVGLSSPFFTQVIQRIEIPAICQVKSWTDQKALIRLVTVLVGTCQNFSTMTYVVILVLRYK